MKKKNKKKYTFCFDIDNTICSTNKLNYKLSQPKNKIIKMINRLYDDGHVINIYTARFMGRNNEDFKKAKKQGYNFTLKQLILWKLKFHKLFFGKPSADFYIDDKALGYKKDWYKQLDDILLKRSK